MSHFAEIDENNVVIRVLVGDDNLPNEGHDWFVENLGGTWIKTSYNTRAGKHLLGGTPFRLNFAREGFLYNEEVDGFVAPPPYPSWSINPLTGFYIPPKPYPVQDEGEEQIVYAWNEDNLDWELINV